MPRHADPEKIYQARRAATFAILTRTRAIDGLDAEHWMTRWEREAAELEPPRFDPAFWDDAAGLLVRVRHSEREEVHEV